MNIMVASIMILQLFRKLDATPILAKDLGKWAVYSAITVLIPLKILKFAKEDR